MRKLEGGGIIQLGGLLLYRSYDRLSVVTGVCTPQTCGAVQDGSPIGREVVHISGCHDDLRRFPERTIGSEGKPIGVCHFGCEIIPMNYVGTVHRNSSGCIVECCTACAADPGKDPQRCLAEFLATMHGKESQHRADVYFYGMRGETQS